MIGDTVNLHQPRNRNTVRGGRRTIELIVNGETIDRVQVPADGKPHDVNFKTRISQSSWIAIRQFPQMHTNPVRVTVNRKPLRASRASAKWCEESVKLLWKKRKHFIKKKEQPAAREAYDRAEAFYKRIGVECRPGT